MNFLTESLLATEQDVLQSMFDVIGDTIINIYSYAVRVNQTTAVGLVCTFTMLLGAALCSLAVGKQVIGTYGLGVQGDSDQDAMEIVFRLCFALGAMGCNSWLFNEMIRFTDAVASDIMQSFPGVSLGSETTFIRSTLTGIDNPTSGLLVGAVVIGMILFAVSSALRGAEITLNKILLPLFALDLMSGNHEKWNMFIFQYFVSFLSYLVQMLCYEMFLFHLLNGSCTFAAGIEGPVITLGWMVLSIRSPKVLEKYIYATGAGQGISKGAGRLGQVIMSVTMRK